MSCDSPSFKIDFLDHVAIRVSDMTISIKWYETVLCLKKYQTPEWGPFPVFMLAGKSGVALFPAHATDPQKSGHSRGVGIDHFAFNVTLDNFEKAKNRYAKLNVQFSFQDHHYFHSIYTKDPDGHTVELTTLVVAEKDFYRLP